MQQYELSKWNIASANYFIIGLQRIFLYACSIFFSVSLFYFFIINKMEVNLG